MESFCIMNAIVQTMDDQASSFLGYVRIQGNKILTIGAGTPPTFAFPFPTPIDAQRGILTPGLIDLHSHVGLYEDSLGFAGEDGNEDTDPVTPQLRALDGINPFDRGFREACEAGVTTVAVSPGSANAIGGQIVLLKTVGRRVDDMVIRSPLAMKFALGENPKSVYRDKDDTPVTRMATAALIREQLYKAKEYLARQERANHDPDVDMPDYDSKLEALLPLLRGEIKAHFHAHRADDIFTALRIAREFTIQPVIIHGTEAYLMPDLIAAEHIPIISGPFLTDRSKPELHHLTEAAPGRLCRAGIETALTVDHPETPLRLLPLAAMLAVRAGMDKTDALRALTTVPAHIADVSDRIGRIAPGLDADLVLWDGDPLDFKTHAQIVWINGQMIYRRNSL